MPGLKVNYQTFLFDFAAENSHQGLTLKFYSRLESTGLWLTPLHVHRLSLNPFLNDLLVARSENSVRFHLKTGRQQA